MRKIKESELILTEDGRIYHLGLLPEQLGDYVITVGDPKRVERVSKHFDKIEVRNQKREFITHTGYIGTKKISVIGTGIGPDNIDIMINEIDALKNIDFNTRTIKPEFKKLHIIRMGTSGALRSEIPVDSIVGSSYGLGLDGLLNFYQYDKDDEQILLEKEVQKEVPDLYEICRPYIFKGSKYLLDNIAGNFIQGMTMTAGGFYAPQGRELRLGQRTRKIIDDIINFKHNDLIVTNFEMETSAIYGLAKLLGHEALSVNAIIANRVNKTFSKNPYDTIDRMIVESLEKIDNL